MLEGQDVAAVYSLAGSHFFSLPAETLRMAMATSSQLGLFSSPFFCSSAVQPKQTGASSRELACGPSVAARPQMKVICQKEEEVDVSRRCVPNLLLPRVPESQLRISMSQNFCDVNAKRSMSL